MKTRLLLVGFLILILGGVIGFLMCKHMVADLATERLSNLRADNLHLAFEVEELYPIESDKDAVDANRVRLLVRAMACRDMHGLAKDNVSDYNAAAAVSRYLKLLENHKITDENVNAIIDDLNAYLDRNLK